MARLPPPHPTGREAELSPTETDARDARERRIIHPLTHGRGYEDGAARRSNGQDRLQIGSQPRSTRHLRETSSSTSSDLELVWVGHADPVATPVDEGFVQRMITIVDSFSDKPPSIDPLRGRTLPLLGSIKRHLDVVGLSDLATTPISAPEPTPLMSTFG